MKKIIICLMGSFSFFSLHSFAQSGNANPSLSVGVEAGIPASKDFSDFWGVGIGGSAKLAIPVITNGAVTLSAGYMSFTGKTVSGIKVPAINFIPFKAGFRYSFTGGVYLEPQLGITSVKFKGSDSESDFTYAINLGYAIKTVDISARYESLSKSGNTNSFIGLRVAYNFSL